MNDNATIKVFFRHEFYLLRCLDLSAREERIEILKTSLDAKKTEINVLKQNNTAEKASCVEVFGYFY